MLIARVSLKPDGMEGRFICGLREDLSNRPVTSDGFGFRTLLTVRFPGLGPIAFRRATARINRMENAMKKTGKVLATVATVFALTLGGAITASASTEYVGGGTFQYDADASLNWCNYYHPSKKHRCTVQNKYGSLRSPDRAGNQWAYQSQPVARTGNQVFWFVY